MRQSTRKAGAAGAAHSSSGAEPDPLGPVARAHPLYTRLACLAAGHRKSLRLRLSPPLPLPFCTWPRKKGRLDAPTQFKATMLRNPTHAASLPFAMIPNCAATRHIHFHLHGDGPAKLEAPSLADWPDVTWTPDVQKSKRVDLNALTPAEVASWKPGDRLLLNGKILTGRDAAHKRIQDMLAKGEELPVSFKNRVIYYVGPVDPVRDEAVGPAGPTTSTRMDKFTEMMLAKTGLIAMIGKAERGPVAIEAIKKHQSAYLMAVGGAAYLVSKAIKTSKVVGFADLGMEAIYEFDVQDMPVTVAVDSKGTSMHHEGPKEWQARIGKIPVVTA